MRWFACFAVLLAWSASALADGTNTANPARVSRERDQLQTELQQRSQQLADAQAQNAQALTQTNQALVAVTKQQVDQLARAVDTLRDRLALLDADAAPISTNISAVTPSAQTNAPAARGAHTSKELPPGAGALMADATMALRENDFKSAESKYNDILRQDENNVYVLDYLAGAQYQAGEYDACEKTVLHSVALDPDDPKSLYLLGILRYRENRLDDALAALNHSVQSNPTNAGTQYYLGAVLAEKGQRPAAETAFRKALQIDPDYADAHYNLAFVYATETPPSLELARWHYKRALDLGHAKNDGMEKVLAPQTP